MKRRFVGGQALCAVGLLAVSAGPAWAQPPAKPPAKPAVTQPAKPPAKPRGAPKWSFEIYAGPGFSPGASGGTAATLPAGETFPTETDILRPTRANPSWFFGDGAALFNQVNAQFASQFGQAFAQIVPLDTVLGSAALNRRPAPAFGARLTRDLSPRLGLEFAFSRSSSRWALTSGAEDGLEASRASFEAAFGGLLNLIPQTGLQVASTLAVSEASQQETSITAALVVQLSRSRRLSTHAVVGAGRAFFGGATPEIRLRGNYAFRFLDSFPISETDTVTVRFADRDGAVVGVVGAGMAIPLASRQALRIDLRTHLRQGGLTTTLDAQPAVATGNPPLVLPSATSPSIQFSSVQGIRSSLNGSAGNLTTFTADGIEARVHLTIGYQFRF